MPSIRIGIVGARRNVQGIGHFVAAHLSDLGADVRGVVGTTRDTAAEACNGLQQQFGLQVRGYTDLAEMIEAEQLGAVAICSPQSTHRQLLQTALEMNQHVLCEKPLVFDPARDDLADARPLVDGFARAGRVLMVNQQWPYTLPAFDRCYPDAGRRVGGVRRLAMLLAPAEDGLAMIPNSLPHVISMLLACAPAPGDIKDLSFQRQSPGSLDIRFAYAHDQGQVEVYALLRQVASQPRPAGYAVNDCTVARRIVLPTYRMFLEPVTAALDDVACQDAQVLSDERNRVPLEDPLRLLLTDFIRRIGLPHSPCEDGLILLENVRLVAEVYRAAEASLAE